MQAKKNAAVLIIGLCSHGLAMARALHKENVVVYAVEKNMSLPGVQTNCVEKVFQVDSFEDTYLKNALITIRNTLSQWKDIVLMPTNDNHVKFVGSHIQEICQHYLVSWANCHENILKLQKKEELEAASANSGLNYPRSYLISSAAENLSALDEFRYPLIIKPAKPLSSFKTEMIKNPSALKEALLRFQKDLPILAQEFIAGSDSSIYFAEMLLQNGEVIQINTGRKLRSYPPERGQATIAELYDDAKVAQLATQFVEPFALNGPIALELKKDQHGEYWVIEPTVGRTEFLVQIIIAAGVNQPYQEFMLAIGEQVPRYTTITPTIWFDNEREPLSFLELCWKQKTLTPYQKKPTFTYFDKRDLKPFVYALAALAKRVLLQRA
ncbi:hypothetical protein [Rheinheimera sp. 4Y26]|uniref:hypothetical protein n=1 Tax=Rheinheimera sp. 4Y26 TaxID=2977811 RepID=UPI0021B0E1E5|nr:hypothetical protein [Rheinheimera sp. 4Y26]MCT6699038.1 hypothetical protein [Rheinheimera sp. 4Y26]